MLKESRIGSHIVYCLLLFVLGEYNIRKSIRDLLETIGKIFQFREINTDYIYLFIVINTFIIVLLMDIIFLNCSVSL